MLFGFPLNCLQVLHGVSLLGKLEFGSLLGLKVAQSDAILVPLDNICLDHVVKHLLEAALLLYLMLHQLKLHFHLSHL